MTGPEPESAELELERTFELMDVVDEIRRRRRRVEEHLELSDREAIKQHLIERYAAMGHAADPRLLDEAIDRVLANANRFRPPVPGLQLRLARLYVRRGKISRRLAVPLVALAVIAGGGGLLAGRINDIWYGRHERAVERQVLELAERAAEVAARYERLGADAGATSAGDDPEVSPRPSVDDPLAMADERLGRVRLFLEEFAPGGDAASAISEDNYTRVGTQAVRIADRLHEASGYLDQAERALGADRLMAEALRLYDRVVEIAADPDAIDRAVRYLDGAREAAAAGSEADAATSLASLRELEGVLGTAYTIRIIAGVERDGTRTYLIVEALDAEGDPVAVSVRNEETGRTEAVSEWGERVPRDVYDRVRADLDDNGVIDDDLFGRKTRGSLEPERAFEDVGQITEW